MLVSDFFSKSNEKNKGIKSYLSPNKMKRREISLLIKEKWIDSKFIISYNFYGLENRNIEILKLKLKEKFSSKFISFGVFKNSSIIKAMQGIFFNNDNNIVKVSGNNFLFFVSENVDIFDFLSIFRKIDEKFFSEIYKKNNTSSSEFLDFDNRLNWAFVNNEFKDSNELIIWSKVPNKNILFNNLISLLLSNLMILILCFEKIIKNS